MADNYLKRKMEEHRAGGTARRTANASSPAAGSRPGYMTIKFPPRRVFITGGAKGVGRAIIDAFREASCQVAFCDVNCKTGNTTAQETGARYYPLDVADTEALDRAMRDVIKRWGGIDIIINNVGTVKYQAIEETSVTDFSLALATCLNPVFVTAKRMAIHRRSLQELPSYGRIINIASTRALMSEGNTEGYSAAKGGIVSLTHSLMMTMAPLNVTVNAISPGWITNDHDDPPTEKDHAQHPSHRVGGPEDVAHLCLFLACEESDFINGQNIVLDGGMTKKMIYA